MLTEYAVLASVTPICSAIAMKRLLNTSSSTGSAVVPIACARCAASTRSRTMWSRGVSVARQPGSITVVEFGSRITAGPAIASPGRRSPRSYTFAAHCRSCV